MRDAFLARGHDAISCDLLPTDVPGPHHRGDVIELIGSKQDGHYDLIIAHPTCTKLCVSGNGTYGEGKPRYSERLEAVTWTVMFWELAKRKARRVCFENPVGVLNRLSSGRIPKANYVQPYQFGHMEQKKNRLAPA